MLESGVKGALDYCYTHLNKPANNKENTQQAEVPTLSACLGNLKTNLVWDEEEA